MSKTKINTLRIEANSPEQANFLAVSGIRLLFKKIKSEKRSIEKYILACHFNKRDSADEIGKCYMHLIDTLGEILGWEAQEVLFTASTDEEGDMQTTYTIDIMFCLD